MLNDLIKGLPEVVQLSEQAVTIHGLSIAKVFRNKEGHTVTATHLFNPTDYKDIASALVALYRDAFGQALSVQFSVARNERAIWKLSRAAPSIERTVTGKSMAVTDVESPA